MTKPRADKQQAGFGMSWVFIATTVFLTECVARQAAGAFALGNMLRNPGAAVAAVVIPSLVARMGHGWCFTGLALLDLVLVGSAVMSKIPSLLSNGSSLEMKRC